MPSAAISHSFHGIQNECLTCRCFGPFRWTSLDPARPRRRSGVSLESLRREGRDRSSGFLHLRKHLQTVVISCNFPFWFWSCHISNFNRVKWNLEQNEVNSRVGFWFLKLSYVSAPRHAGSESKDCKRQLGTQSGKKRTHASCWVTCFFWYWFPAKMTTKRTTAMVVL